MEPCYNQTMKGKILITDSLFIFAEHEQRLVNQGYEIERLDKPKATEEELIEAVKGKVEQVTDAVIEAADELRVISFTGADAHGFIPGFNKATEKGIAITTTPGTNTYAVAEYTLSVMLAMTRNIFELGRTGDKSFQTTSSLKDLTVGIVGTGHIGSRMAKILSSLGVKEILYTNRTIREALEEKTRAIFVGMDELLERSDIVTLHVSKEIGEGFFDKEKLSKMKDGALLVNCGFMGGVNRDDLLSELETGRLRAAEDGPKDDRFESLPLSTWYCSNDHTAYNTHEANMKASDMAISSILNILERGDDKFKVN